LGDEVVNVADPPVYVVILRGEFTSNRGAFNNRMPHGKQLTLVLPQAPRDVGVLDTGIGPVSPLPEVAQSFTY
jgi:hypothetical protein